MTFDEVVDGIEIFFSGSDPSHKGQIKIGNDTIKSLGIEFTNLGTYKDLNYHQFTLIRGENSFNLQIAFVPADEIKYDHPYLIVGFLENQYPTVQINLERFLDNNSTGWELWHDGRMTKKNGHIKNADVVRRTREMFPYLVNSRDEIVLGTITGLPLSLQNTGEVLHSLFDYCIVRDSIRI